MMDPTSHLHSMMLADQERQGLSAAEGIAPQQHGGLFIPPQTTTGRPPLGRSPEYSAAVLREYDRIRLNRLMQQQQYQLQQQQQVQIPFQDHRRFTSAGAFPSRTATVLDSPGSAVAAAAVNALDGSESSNRSLVLQDAFLRDPRLLGVTAASASATPAGGLSPISQPYAAFASASHQHRPALGSYYVTNERPSATPPLALGACKQEERLLGSEKQTTISKQRGDGPELNLKLPRPDASVRPDVRVRVGVAGERYNRALSRDDVVIVPDLFGKEGDINNYNRLKKEICEIEGKGAKDLERTSGSGSSLMMAKHPDRSRIIMSILDTLCRYFNIDKESASFSAGWRNDSSGWRAFHHDKAASARKTGKAGENEHNITVAVNFGEDRELAFLHSGHERDEHPVRVYVPHANNSVVSYGEAVNINWKHGVNALPEEMHDSKGTITIILWGYSKRMDEQDGPPPKSSLDPLAPSLSPKETQKKPRKSTKQESSGKRKVAPSGEKKRKSNPSGKKTKAPRKK